jgi:hypothetical protein
MIGGLAVSFIMELLIYPIIFYIYKRIQLRHTLTLPPAAAARPPVHTPHPEPAHAQ